MCVRKGGYEMASRDIWRVHCIYIWLGGCVCMGGGVGGLVPFHYVEVLRWEMGERVYICTLQNTHHKKKPLHRSKGKS